MSDRLNETCRWCSKCHATGALHYADGGWLCDDCHTRLLNSRIAHLQSRLREAENKIAWYKAQLIEHKDALGECLDVIHREIAKDDERLEAFQEVLETSEEPPAEEERDDR